MPRQRRRRNKVVQETDYDSSTTEEVAATVAADAEDVRIEADLDKAEADEIVDAMEAEGAFDEAPPVDEAVTDAQSSVVDDEVARRRKIIADAPYHAEGFNVYDGRDRRIVICGTDDNRAASGPGLALSIAEVFNRIAGGH